MKKHMINRSLRLHKGHVFSLNLLKSPLKHFWGKSAAGPNPGTDKETSQPLISKLA